jgi:hypothetical protein
MHFDSTWISNLRTKKKIGIRMIDTDGDFGRGYQINLQIGYSTKQSNKYYIYNIQIELNLIRQKISDIGQIIVDRIKSCSYVASDNDVSFDCMYE